MCSLWRASPPRDRGRGTFSRHPRATPSQQREAGLSMILLVCQNKTSKQSMITPVQLHDGALARVGAELSLCEVCGWIGTCDPLLPAPRCSFPCQLAPQCFWASLHFGHFGQTQTPFLGFSKCPKTNSLSFRPAGHPEAEEGGVSKRLERVL